MLSDRCDELTELMDCERAGLPSCAEEAPQCLFCCLSLFSWKPACSVERAFRSLPSKAESSKTSADTDLLLLVCDSAGIPECRTTSAFPPVGVELRV